VDHPDLIHPNDCIQHKFCDDCILKAFIFSNNCPVCVDSFGLIASDGAYNAVHYHTAELDTKGILGQPHSYFSLSESVVVTY